MIYYLKKKDTLETIESYNSSYLPYPNIHDLRNYAFLYIYPNQQIDAVIRTVNLVSHIYAILPLLKNSSHLKALKSYINVDDPTHFDLDIDLVKSGVLTIYYSTSHLQDELSFGYINIPSSLTDFQKNFLIEHRIFFESYEEVLINQYCDEKETLVELNEFGDGTFLALLDQITDYTPSHSYRK